MTLSRDQILREMGLGPIWRLRSKAVDVSAAAASTVATVDAPGSPVSNTHPGTDDEAIAGMSWKELSASVSACRRCRLCERRKKAVLGVGDITADWLMVGEGPGAEEDERGEPFVGQAGKLLDNMLAAIGLKRGEDVYIANAVKCRPPENRKPAEDESAACQPYLQRQIGLLRPKLIVAFGATAAQTLLHREIRIGAERGKLHDCRGVPLIVTYHPSYLLRTVMDKAKAWEDLCFMRQTMQKQKEA